LFYYRELQANAIFYLEHTLPVPKLKAAGEAEWRGVFRNLDQVMNLQPRLRAEV